MTTPLILDISRTVSRIGAGGESGVDRVERAYIRELSAWSRPVFFLTRVLRGMALLDRDGVQALLRLADTPGGLPRADAWGLLARRQSPARRRAETAVRQQALGWARHAKAADLIRRHLGGAFTYLNVGHTNLEATRLSALRSAGCIRIAVMIHDVIPLDFPEYARAGTPQKFEAFLKGVGRAADLLIYNSADTAARTAEWMQRWGLHPEGVTALLGVDPLGDAPLPTNLAEPAQFLMLGTIEPRKNHLMVLTLWRRFWDEMDAPPHLHIVGRRGWENENIIDQLERAPFMGKCVFEHGFVSDTELGAMMAGARGLLFPSFAEGFGYPLAEACQIGIPALCSDLPVFREVASEGATYLDPLDGPAWMQAISDLASATPPARKPVAVPQWETHFDVIRSAV